MFRKKTTNHSTGFPKGKNRPFFRAPNQHQLGSKGKNSTGFPNQTHPFLSEQSCPILKSSSNKNTTGWPNETQPFQKKSPNQSHNPGFIQKLIQKKTQPASHRALSAPTQGPLPWPGRSRTRRRPRRAGNPCQRCSSEGNFSGGRGKRGGGGGGGGTVSVKRRRKQKRGKPELVKRFGCGSKPLETPGEH